MLTVPGRLLKPPLVKYCFGKKENPVFGEWNMANKIFQSSGTLTKWSFLVIGRATFDSKDDVERLADTFRLYGVSAGQPNSDKG